jgi:hypothetical protein
MCLQILPNDLKKIIIAAVTFFTISTTYSQALEIVRIETENETVSQGQDKIRVQMVIQSGRGFQLTNIQAELRFYRFSDSDADPEDLTHEYIQVRKDKVSSVNGQEQAILEFEVAVSETASPGNVIIDGKASGNRLLLIVNTADSANETDSWIVQTPAALSVRLDSIPSPVTINQTFEVSARVLNLGTAEIDDTGQIELSVPKGFAISGDKKRRFRQDEIIVWSVQAPDSPTDKPESIEVRIADKPIELNTGKAALIVDERDSGSVEVYDNRALNILRIVAQRETVSLGQQGIRVDMVVESNQRNPITDIDAALNFYRFNDSDSDSDLEDLTGEYIQRRIDNNDTIVGEVTLTFEVAVNDDASIQTVAIDGSVSGRSGTIFYLDVDGADQTDTWVVQTPAELQVQFTAIGLLQTIGDTFDVKANVLNRASAGIDGSGELLLTIPSGYAVLPSTPLQQFFVQDETLLWRIVAPQFPTPAPEPFTVEIREPPLEINTGLPARIIVSSDVDSVQTIPAGNGGVGFIKIDSVRIVAPGGARDGTLSTDQDLWIAAYLRRENATNVNAQINIPTTTPTYRFATGETLTERIPDDAGNYISVQWHLITPQSERGPDIISVDVEGVDAETGNFISNVKPDSVRLRNGEEPLQITVHPRATLRLSAFRINDPDRILTIGQRFAVTTAVENTGVDAEGGSLRLSLPEGFVALDDTVRPFDYGGVSQLSWLVEAPAFPMSLTSLRLFWDHVPLDVNSNQPAVLENDSLEIIVSVEDLFCLKVSLPGRAPITIVKSEQNVEVTSLQFHNDTNRQMLIHGLSMIISDKAGIEHNPGDVISRISVSDKEDGTVYSELTSFTQNRMNFDFSQPVRLLPFESVDLSFAIDVRSEVSAEAVQFVIQNPGEDIEAYDEQENPVAIRDSRCLEYPGALASGFSSIGDAGLDATFFNYPNPFPRAREGVFETNFHYYLAEDSDVNIRIYTLFGELVWSRHYTAGEPGTTAGRHEGSIKWNAKNGRDLDVLNGVYIAVLEANGEKAMTKVAVAR